MSIPFANIRSVLVGDRDRAHALQQVWRGRGGDGKRWPGLGNLAGGSGGELASELGSPV